MTITDKLEYEKIYRILQKTVKSRDELEKFMGSLTQNILKEDDSRDKLSMALFLLQEEIIPFSKLFTYSNYINGQQLINEYQTGVKNCIERSIYDYDISVYYGNNELISYKDEDNIDIEVQRILESVDEEIFHYEEVDGQSIKVSDGMCLETFIKNNINDLSSEFLRINNIKPSMISSERILIYSALLNFSKSEIEKTSSYKDQIKNTICLTIDNFIDRRINPLGMIKVLHQGQEYTWNGQYLIRNKFYATPVENLTKIIYLEKEFIWKNNSFRTPALNIPDNWDQIRRIFIEFLENLSKRTINY